MRRLAAIAALLVIVATCRAGGRSAQELEVDALRANLEVLGTRLGIALPSGTQVVHVETESGIDDAIFAKLLVPSARADAFIESLHVTDYRRGAEELFGPDRGAWDPHQAKGLRIGDVLLPSTRGLVVGLDESHADSLVVYVLNHGT